ncbi:unnamed protein product [Enterobius vermicularis]|uniref:Prostatic spermine-binding protein-like n=1 Tax=Enterobius vermicularis TaxID=51028 RepID=A0A0N4VJ45_ENTVE|nr:unnamed protein product [Enterobius vermicularis]
MFVGDDDYYFDDDEHEDHGDDDDLDDDNDDADTISSAAKAIDDDENDDVGNGYVDADGAIEMVEVMAAITMLSIALFSYDAIKIKATVLM